MGWPARWLEPSSDDPGITIDTVILMLVITALAWAAMTRRGLVTRGEAVTLLAA